MVDGVAGGDLVLSTLDPGRLIALTNLGSGVSHRLRWPSTLPDHVMGLIDTHPEGRLASKPQVTWTADGRLLLLAGLADDPASGLVGVWRPGQPRIAVRRVPLPDPGPPSGFRFVIW